MNFANLCLPNSKIVCNCHTDRKRSLSSDPKGFHKTSSIGNDLFEKDTTGTNTEAICSFGIGDEPSARKFHFALPSHLLAEAQGDDLS